MDVVGVMVAYLPVVRVCIALSGEALWRVPLQTEFLNNVFLEQWIGRGGPTLWLPRSSRFLRTSNTVVNSTEFDNVQGLQHWIQNGFESICATPWIFQ